MTSHPDKTWAAGPGLSDDYWKRYFEADEIEEILDSISGVTAIVSGGVPIHLRLWEHGRADAATVVLAHGLITYSLQLSRLHLRLFRAGFDVVSWDLPGYGLSGGTRTGPRLDDLLQAWQDVVAFVSSGRDAPLFVAGLAEDGIAAYYALADHPAIDAMSLHALCEYGDPDNVAWTSFRGVQLLRAVEKVLPHATMDSHRGVPWTSVFGEEAAALYEADPLRTRRLGVHVGAWMTRPKAPPVRFEDCRTPVQILTSSASDLFPPAMNERAFARLGCEKEHVVLEGQPFFSLSAEFADAYVPPVVSWFERNAART